MIAKPHAAYSTPPEGPLQVTVSGGRSSGRQFLEIVEANGGLPRGAVATFQNTGFEDNRTLDFVSELEAFSGVPIAWLERDNASPFKVRLVSHNSAARHGEPFLQLYTETVPKRRDGTAGVRPLPNPVQRTCTAELKMKTAHRYLTKVLGWRSGYATAIGYRADEPARIARRRKVDSKKWPEMGGLPWFPMAEAGIDAGQVLSFWRAMPFDLRIGDWRIPAERVSDFGNCRFCFMVSGGKLKERMALWPREYLEPWLALEARNSDRSDRFRKDRPSMAEILAQVEAGDRSDPTTGRRAGDGCGSCVD